MKFWYNAGLADESRGILPDDAVRVCSRVLSPWQQDQARGSSLQTWYSEVTRSYREQHWRQDSDVDT